MTHALVRPPGSGLTNDDPEAVARIRIGASAKKKGRRPRGSRSVQLVARDTTGVRTGAWALGWLLLAARADDDVAVTGDGNA
ncbi:MAG: hypothetical protein ACLP22_00860, partial [Solirubrobacteraceae bacterium]